MKVFSKLLLLHLFFNFINLLEGTEKISGKVVICGVCKNVEQQLPITKEIIEKIGELFTDYRVIIYENNSIDNTKAQLQEWVDSNSKIAAYMEDVPLQTLIANSINITVQGTPFYTESIARARNIVLDHLFSDTYSEFDYVVWIDMDFTKHPNYNEIYKVFCSKHPWDAVFGCGVNPAGQYFDWYAFRDRNLPLGPELLGNWWHRELSKSLDLNRSGWKRVISAFGGFGIYRKTSIKDCRYSGVVTDNMCKLYSRYIEVHKNSKNSLIRKYFNLNRSDSEIQFIKNPIPGLRKQNRNTKISLSDRYNNIYWRINSGVDQFPSVCEHVAFHCDMFVQGHNQLFLNRDLIFEYDER